MTAFVAVSVVISREFSLSNTYQEVMNDGNESGVQEKTLGSYPFKILDCSGLASQRIRTKSLPFLDQSRRKLSKMDRIFVKRL